MRILALEGKKLARPVLVTMSILTILTCILSCTLYREYSIYFNIDAWEIGTEYIGFLFPLFVTVPVCWQLYYERRDRFLAYTLPRIGKRRYLGAKWCACALSAFLILFVPCFLSALCALYINAPNELMQIHGGYSHVFQAIYTQMPLLYALLLSLWKGLIGVLAMTFGFVLALYSNNIFVILTGPFIYVVLENFALSILGFPEYRLVTAFEPTSLSTQSINAGSFLVGPLLLCGVMGLIILYYGKVKKRSIYPV